MGELLRLFVDNLLPIFLAGAAGYWLGSALQIDPRSLSRVVFYVFSPCLVFTLLTRNQLSDQDFLSMTGFAVLLLASLGLLTWLLGRLLRLERNLLIAVMLTTLFMNAGNYGLSVNLFAFGEVALAYASLFFVTMSILSYTVGVLFASLGTLRIKEALIGLLKLPLLYALLLALAFTRLNWTLPVAASRTISVLADAAIPVMLVLLGLQLQRAQWSGRLMALSLTNALRLVVSPILAIGLSAWLGIEGTARQAGILEAAMPSAVMNTVLATEFEVEPSFITAAVFSSTLLSPLTLTLLLAYLGA